MTTQPTAPTNRIVVIPATGELVMWEAGSDEALRFDEEWIEVSDASEWKTLGQVHDLSSWRHNRDTAHLRRHIADSRAYVSAAVKPSARPARPGAPAKDEPFRHAAAASNQAAMTRYHSRYDNSRYCAATSYLNDPNKNTPRQYARADRLINAALALCGSPYHRLDVNTQWTAAESAFLNLFI